MKTMSTIVMYLVVTVSNAVASGGTEAESLGLMATLFIAFGVLIVLHQFIPGLTLLCGMLKGLFSPIDKKIPNVGRN